MTNGDKIRNDRRLDLDDVENIAKLLAAYILSYREEAK